MTGVMRWFTCFSDPKNNDRKNIAPATYPTTAYKSVRNKGTLPPAVADGDSVTEGEVRIEVIGLVLLEVLVLAVLVTVLMDNDDDDGQGQWSCC
jgi:hypothetical protein